MNIYTSFDKSHLPACSGHRQGYICESIKKERHRYRVAQTHRISYVVDHFPQKSHSI